MLRMTNHPSLEELKLLIASKLTIEEVMDILGWSMYDLVEEIETSIEENLKEFEDACR
jgi:hypothetical protein